MTSIASCAVHIQTSPQSVPSIPPWFGEVTMIAHALTHFGVLPALQERVRLVRPRFGHYEVVDFVAVLIGYALSGEASLQAFYERLAPFALPYMALFGRHRLPHRSTLSRFLSALDAPAVEALRSLFQEDLRARLRPQSPCGGLWDRAGTQWLVVDVDGTRQAARQRAVPQTGELPAAHRRFEQVCAPGYRGRQRGEVVRTRTTVLHTHTSQWLGTFAGAGNGDYRGELLRAAQSIKDSLIPLSWPGQQVIVRLDGLYGNAAPLSDLLGLGLGLLVRGKDYALLDLPQVQARLVQPPDQQTTHPETGTQRALFDCPSLSLTPTGPRLRVIVATHAAAAIPSPIGVTRDGLVCELFYTTLPAGAFTPADVVDLYLQRGAFETVLSDEDHEQDPDRWCSHTACGQEFWQVLSQWMWNLRLELGQYLHASPLRTTLFAPALPTPPEPAAPLPVDEAGLSQESRPLPTPPEPAASLLMDEAGLSQESRPLPTPPEPSAPLLVSAVCEATPIIYGPPIFAQAASMGGFAGAAFTPQPDGTLRCPANQPLYPQERRPERNGWLRVFYVARIGHCRSCPQREQCLGHGKATKQPRRVSAILRPLQAPCSSASEPTVPPLPPVALAHPILWRDGPRSQTRRAWMQLLQSQTVMITALAAPLPDAPAAPEQQWLTRRQRAHWRLSWAQRLARNAASCWSSAFQVHLFGIPPALAAVLGLESR